MNPDFGIDRDSARQLDAEDPLARYREQFHFPLRRDGRRVVYLCGNSLGLQPRRALDYVRDEMEDWQRLAVQAHFDGRTPWYSYHEVFRDTGARLVGAQPGEVVMMNGLTTNLHLMMVSFYRPTPERFKIVMEGSAFPSDTYAVKSQLAFHGVDPERGLVLLKPREGEHTLRDEDIQKEFAEHGDEIALVMMGGVNYFTGQLFDMKRITELAHQHGALAGFDLAHAAGNAHLELHDWGVDFAVWCSYKYLNSGPGGIGGCFVHQRHAEGQDLPRFAGWWGNDPKKRFQMHLLSEFEPRSGADGWQLSNPPILAMAPLRASLEIFDEVGMEAAREKSQQLTGYLEYLIDERGHDRIEILTPRQPQRRGCQLSLKIKKGAEELLTDLETHGVICDFRRPDVIRAAPVPLYNSYEDVWEFVEIIQRATHA